MSELNFNDLRQILAVERMKNNDLVDAVQKLRLDVSL